MFFGKDCAASDSLQRLRPEDEQRKALELPAVCALCWDLEYIDANAQLEWGGGGVRGYYIVVQRILWEGIRVEHDATMPFRMEGTLPRAMNIPRVWLVGWDEIEQSTGLSHKILKPLIVSERLPVRYIGGRPVTSKTQLERWLTPRG